MNRDNSGNNSESLLIQRIREGEEYAFEIAFLKYHTPLSRYIWKYVRSKQLSEGIVQEVFAEVWENRKDLNPSGHLRGFLYEVARNKALDHIKHKRIVKEYICEAKQQNRETHDKKIYRTENNYQDLRDKVAELVNDLPPRGRQIYKLSREEGLTYAEISEYLDISIKTVETHMRRSLKKLRDHLSEFIPIFFAIGMLLGFCQVL
ncbi:MAG: RNA polymerase sigma-70 factor [Balneolaceae bacterium]|nr:RNA polymerase sigma-70 factor [Balneolaceae bacterium]